MRKKKEKYLTDEMKSEIDNVIKEKGVNETFNQVVHNMITLQIQQEGTIMGWNPLIGDTFDNAMLSYILKKKKQ